MKTFNIGNISIAAARFPLDLHLYRQSRGSGGLYFGLAFLAFPQLDRPSAQPPKSNPSAEMVA